MNLSTAFFGKDALDALSESARRSPRRRVTLNFHPRDSHPAHRFLNAVEPESYIRPHRHLDPLKDETFLAVRGAFGVVLFDESGNIAEKRVIRPGSEVLGAHIPAGTFHALVALETGSIFFEVKAGPYDAASDKDWAPWAPAENDGSAAQYRAALRALFD